MAWLNLLLTQVFVVSFKIIRRFVPLKPPLGMTLVSRTLLQSTSLMRNVPDLDPVDELLLLCGEKPPADVG